MDEQRYQQISGLLGDSSSLSLGFIDSMTGNEQLIYTEIKHRGWVMVIESLSDVTLFPYELTESDRDQFVFISSAENLEVTNRVKRDFETHTEFLRFINKSEYGYALQIPGPKPMLFKGLVNAGEKRQEYYRQAMLEYGDCLCCGNRNRFRIDSMCRTFQDLRYCSNECRNKRSTGIDFGPLQSESEQSGIKRSLINLIGGASLLPANLQIYEELVLFTNYCSNCEFPTDSDEEMKRHTEQCIFGGDEE